MASQKGWESYEHVVEDLTKAGIVKESWGKQSTESSKRDVHESFHQGREKCKTIDDGIAGFSSSDDDDDGIYCPHGFVPASKLIQPRLAKRTPAGRRAESSKPKRLKKRRDDDCNSPLPNTAQEIFFPLSNTTPSTCFDGTNKPPYTPKTNLHAPTCITKPHLTPTSNTPRTNHGRTTAIDNSPTKTLHPTPRGNILRSNLGGYTPINKPLGKSPHPTPTGTTSRTKPSTTTTTFNRPLRRTPQSTPRTKLPISASMIKTPGQPPYLYPADITPCTNERRNSSIRARKCKLFQNSFEISFQTETDTTSAQEDTKDDITWSNSDSSTDMNDIKNIWSDSASDSDTNEIKTASSQSDSSDNYTRDKMSEHDVKQEDQEKQGNDNIGEFDSDNELSNSIEQLDIEKEESQNISSNTPTPLSTPCTSPKALGESRPSVDSTKKGRKKYIRGGLAERLQRLTTKENFSRSFWLQKTKQKNDDQDVDELLLSGRNTAIVQVLTEKLDHGVYILACHVISQDCEPFLPKHVTVLLENERRRYLDINITSTMYLRIYSPWKLHHLPGSSGPVLMSMEHCEVVSSSTLDFIPEDITDSFDDAQARTEVSVHSKVESQSEIRPGSNTGVQDEGIAGTVVEWPLQDSLRYEGVSMTARVNVTGRIQRVYWRYADTTEKILQTNVSLAESVIENAKTLATGVKRVASLCCLVQGLACFCCEVMVPEDFLINRPDWRKVLCRSEGIILSFSKLRLLEHKGRKRYRQLFELIDSLKNKSFKKQRSCLAFKLDEHSLVNCVSTEKQSDCAAYSHPERLSSAADCRRVSFSGRLLHVRFTKDKYHNTKHICLWLSAQCIAQRGVQSDVMAEPAVIQVRYSSGRTLEWDASTLLAGQLLSMQDLVFDKENPRILAADIFSKIQLVTSQSSLSDFDESPRDIHEIWHRTMTTTMTDEEYTCLKSFPVAKLPNFNENCMVGHLVMFEGVICDVDHDNAFSFYTCPSCHNENISEISDSSLQYHCDTCSLEFNSPVTNITLEVYLKSTYAPASSVKVKLLQQTITSLLSGSKDPNTETYDVNCVLNRYIGPITCCISEKTQDGKSKISFKLEELDSSSWNILPITDT